MNSFQEKTQYENIFFEPALVDRFPHTIAMWHETEAERRVAEKRAREREELLCWVRLAMRRHLNRRLRRLVELHYFEDMPVQEMSRRFKCHSTTIYRQLARAIAILRARARVEQPQHFRGKKGKKKIRFVISFPAEGHQNN
ncbi:MAG: hypothetical protein GX130_13755 [Candidatus Hydrogenedens sp.]|nr:hypothetical protein [Candidatus Hydrogenedens sp.]